MESDLNRFAIKTMIFYEECSISNRSHRIFSKYNRCLYILFLFLFLNSLYFNLNLFIFMVLKIFFLIFGILYYFTKNINNYKNKLTHNL